VPDELLIAAGVDSVHAREGDPPVTAIDLHPERQAEAAVEMLLARLHGDTPAGPRYVPATLRLRASTGAADRAPPDAQSVNPVIYDRVVREGRTRPCGRNRRCASPATPSIYHRPERAQAGPRRPD
jgi:hypothetical protein